LAKAKSRTKGLDAEQFRRAPAARRRAPLVILLGDEAFLRRESVEAVVDAHPGAERRTIHGVGQRGGPEPAVVLDELRTPSLFGAPLVAVVPEADAFVAAAGDAVAAIAAGGRLRGALVLELKKAPDARRKAGKLLREHAVIVDCSRPYASPPPWKPNAAPWETPLHEWTQARARSLGVRLPPQVAHALVEATGSDLAEVAATVEKLALLAGPGAACTIDHVEAVVGHTRRDGVFDLVDAVGKLDALKAFTMLDRAFEVGLDMRGKPLTDPGGIGVVTLGFLRRMLDDIRRVQSWLSTGGSNDPRAVASSLGMNPMAARRALEHARSWRGRDLAPAYGALLACDRGIKGRIGARLALEALIASWCRRRS
jgi:DNA polymerase III delta subunit